MRVDLAINVRNSDFSFLHSRRILDLNNNNW